MKKFAIGEAMICPKCGYEGSPKVCYNNITDNEYMEVSCGVCGYSQKVLPLDAEENCSSKPLSDGTLSCIE